MKSRIFQFSLYKSRRAEFVSDRQTLHQQLKWFLQVWMERFPPQGATRQHASAASAAAIDTNE